MKYNTFSFGGELWVAYPAGLRFPAAFAQCYPFRGRGIVSKVLYSLNRLHIDKVLLRETEMVPFVKDIAGAEGVAFFWPSRKRSSGRFYGYRVKGNRLYEYWKIGTSDLERIALRREAENVEVACRISGGTFEVPRLLGVKDENGMTVARYQPLPEDAKSLPLTAKWMDRVMKARDAIYSAGYQHGDFGWHNLKISGDSLWILDWEEMSDKLPPLTDEISFESMLDYYNLGKPLNEVWKKIEQKCVCNIYNKVDVENALKSMCDRRIAMGAELFRFVQREDV